MKTHMTAFLAVIFAFSTTFAYGEDLKPLDKDTAAKILASMGYSRLGVGAIVNSQGGLGIARVLGVGVQSGKESKIDMTFEFDNDLGWIFFEFQETGANGQRINREMPPGFGGGDIAHVLLRIWSVNGYKAVNISN
jgi:hypothetical protein